MADIVPLRRLDELGAPFVVLIQHSVREDEDALHIPDLQGLVNAVAAARAAHPRKLSGPDIHFLRKSLGMRRDELAPHLGLTPSSLETIEGGGRPLSAPTEKFLRMLVVHRTDRPSLSAFVDWIMETAIAPMHDAGQLVLRFRHAANEGWRATPS